ncbi:uncharacterized protein LOC112093081 [Morus notabilis]|uniref:uncharacterized protein LOC112093081 n=1 Tax=Morus notabilis TaxID=981085 RepID=UPI000CED4697|nr:uncharacterized protein LOC112093081 [Morus notabilis]
MTLNSPLGCVEVMSMCKLCEITIGGERLRADLIILSMSLFDVVLGMDWLLRYGAIVDCYRSKVTLVTNFRTVISYQADMNPVLRERLLKYSVGGRRNLACFSSLLALEGEPEVIGDSAGTPVVDEFTDVFHDELPGLPPDWEIEFCIDLVSGTTPISIPPYRMAPAEMKELRTQLEELAEKGYIQNSTSPWGALVLFVKKHDGSFRLCIDYRQLNRWERPKNVAEIRSFLRLAGYYRCFVKDFSSIAASTTRLTKKEVRFQWDAECAKCFLGIKGQIDKLTKSAHFIPFCVTYSQKILSELYLEHIVRLHGVPLSITSDRDKHFNATCWRSFQEAMGTDLNFSTSFHPQTDGQSERVIQILENMLRACSLDFGGNWKIYLYLTEFAYNNSYQANIGTAPFEALRRRPLEFREGDFVLLKVSPHKGVVRFGVKGKLAPRYVGSFPIVQRIRVVAYRLALLPELSHVHDVFHVSML